MNINSNRLKQLRAERNWSQEQLSELCGVNLRTIQRIETRGTASLETAKALAAVFDVSVDALAGSHSAPAKNAVLQSVWGSLQNFDDFSGRATRYEFWWFFVLFVLVLGLVEFIHPVLMSMVAIVLLLPFLAVSTRRLRDAGQSPWWQLMMLVPFGILLVMYYWAMPRPEEPPTTEQPSNQ
ncbi:DUF805 domain-containing protein [Pseudidiomarina donghaiensis]|uniref:DUF805 domain-containing protein n=1 Tax=Pseudidiomarina donghaiensis TaxID=519452 RepID=UPI003A96F853